MSVNSNSFLIRCGIQTSFSSVVSPTEKKYGVDSGHWSSCTSSAQGGAPLPLSSSTSAPSPWDPNSLSETSSDFLFDDDRSLTPQLENLKVKIAIVIVIIIF